MKTPFEIEYSFIMKEILQIILYQAKFNDMQSIAILLKSLRDAKENESYELMRCFSIELLDTLFEEIYRAMERNDFKES